MTPHVLLKQIVPLSCPICKTYMTKKTVGRVRSWVRDTDLEVAEWTCPKCGEKQVVNPRGKS